jgi:hypothetical protein
MQLDGPPDPYGQRPRREHWYGGPVQMLRLRPQSKRTTLVLASTLLAACAAVGLRALPTPSASASTARERLVQRHAIQWRPVFFDGFSSMVPLGAFPRADSAHWSAYVNGTRDTSGHGVYEPSSVVSIGGGILSMHLHSQHGRHFVAAILPRIPGAHRGGGFLYGRVSFRMRADRMPGYKLAVLLWPDSGVWPRDGEIDFPEADLNGYLGGWVHRQGARSGSDVHGVWTHVPVTSWHTVTVTWLRHSVTFQVDGHTVGQTSGRIPNTPMHLVIQAETGTTTGPPSTSVSGDVQMHWLSISTPACNPTMSVVPAIAGCAG